MNVKLTLKAIVLSCILSLTYQSGKAQLFSSGNNNIGGNKVGIGVSSPFATLDLQDFSGITQSGFTTVPLLRFQGTDYTQSPLTTNYWDFNMGLSPSLTISGFSSQNQTPVDALKLGIGYVKVFDRFRVTDYSELGEALTPDNTQGFAFSLGMREMSSGTWQGQGVGMFSTSSGEFQLMTSHNTSAISGTTNLQKKVRFTANENGVTVRMDPLKTFVDLSFIDAAQPTDQRAFTIRTVGANHATAPNTLEFWDPNGNGNAFFTMPVRIGGGYADVNILQSGYDLYVEGGIRSTTVKVDAYANWPDYVFAPTYDLMSLKATEEYIEENSHLPGVPSAAEVTKEGIDLAEMNAILLKKVEELTLHMIELQKQVNQLQNEQ